MNVVFSMAFCGLVLLTSASAVQAQDLSQDLVDGRRLTVRMERIDCQARTATLERGVAVDFACSAEHLAMPGTAAIALLTPAATYAPRVFLTRKANEWFPGLSAAEADRAVRQTLRRSGNGMLQLLCVSKPGSAGANAEVMCAVDTPRLQVLVSAASGGEAYAYEVLDEILIGLSIE